MLWFAWALHNTTSGLPSTDANMKPGGMSARKQSTNRTAAVTHGYLPEEICLFEARVIGDWRIEINTCCAAHTMASVVGH
jgi:hypothetical protein